MICLRCWAHALLGLAWVGKPVRLQRRRATPKGIKPVLIKINEDFALRHWMIFGCILLVALRKDHMTNCIMETHALFELSLRVRKWRQVRRYIKLRKEVFRKRRKHASSLFNCQPYNLKGDGPRIIRGEKKRVNEGRFQTIEECLGVKAPQRVDRHKTNVKGSVRFVQWNARNLDRFKIDEITPLATNADVLMIQECGSYLPHIAGFSLAANDLRGQGTAIYVRYTVEYTEWNSAGLQNTGNEGDYVVCGVRIGDLLAISIYIRPLGITTIESRREFVKKVIDIAQIEEKMVIGGDLNDHGKLFSNYNDVPHSPWDILVDEDLIDNMLVDTLESKHASKMELFNDGSITRYESGRALDATFGKGVKCQDWLVVNQGHYSSDHYPIWFSVYGVKYECYKSLRPKRAKKFKLIEWKKITKRLKLELKQRDTSLRGKEVIAWWCDKITSHLLENSHRSKKTYCPFWSDELKTLKNTRNRLRKQGNFEAYKEAHREFRRCFRRSKRQYMRSNLMEIAESHNPLDELYRFVPALKKKKCIKPMLPKQDAKRMANGLSNQFQSIFLERCSFY